MLKRCGPWIVALLAALALPAAPAAAATLTVRIADEDGLADASTWGRVTSSPPGIDCPADCDEPFAAGTPVTLTASATPGYAVARWSVFPDDPGCEQAGVCEVTVAQPGDTSVDVEFHPAAQLHAVPRGAGTIEISPTQGQRSSLCDVDFQQEAPGSSCDQRYVTGTRVTLTAHEDEGGRFIGWTDYGCSKSSPSCTLTLAGERFIAARFTPVRLQVSPGAFGGVTVYPTRTGGFCALLDTSPVCEFTYRAGKTVALRRQHGAEGQFWVGACVGNTDGLLDADVCRLRLYGDELVAAGADNVTSIPPPRGSGIQVRIGGNKRGKVTGRVINGTQTLSCPPRCRVASSDYATVRLVATAFRRNRFVRWSDGSRFRKRIVSLDYANSITANFASRRR